MKINKSLSVKKIVRTKPEDQTLKQRKWLKLYLELGNATEAAIQVYDCKDRDSAAEIGHQNLGKLDFSSLMEESGITDSLLNRKLEEGLSATKQIGARKIVQGARVGHEIRVDANTDSDDFIDVEDYAIRHKYLETALKLKRRLSDKLDLTSGGDKIEGITVTIVDAIHGSDADND